MKLEDALAQLARETARARRRMALERALCAALSTLGALILWAVFALAGLHAALPWAAQSLTATAALAVFALLALRARRSWRAPSEGEARVRLATDSCIDPSALETLRDQPARYDGPAVALWRRARERAIEHVAKLRAGPPRPKLDEADPYRARYALAATLVGAFIFAGAAAPERLARAFLPDPGPLLGDRPIAVEAWAAPADYTHAAPVSLSDRLGDTVATPPSIEVTVRVTGPAGAPRLVFRGQRGDSVRFTRAADGAWEARLAVSGAGKLSIVRFYERGFWRLTPAVDAVPQAAFTAPVANLPDERASIAWRASDDYGLTGLVLRVRPINPPPGLARADPFDTALDVAAGAPRQAEGQSELELGAHPYAGLEVEARLIAIDALGQEGASEALRFTMPEPVLQRPLARAALEMRRHILADRRAYRPVAPERRRTLPAGDVVLGNQRIEVRGDDQRHPPLARAPAGVRTAARLLDLLTADAQDGYFRDRAVYVGLRLARSELGVADTSAAANVAAETLWHVALRAEYGGAADTRNALEQAQHELSQSLQQPGDRQAARERAQALRNAVERYLRSLAEEAMRNGGAAVAEDTRERTEITERDIERMLDDIERMAEQGRNDEAAAASQALTDMLQNLDMELQQADAEAKQQQRAEESAEDLSDVMSEQDALNEQTRQAQRRQQEQQQQQSGQGGSGSEQEGGHGGDQLAERQAEIREALSDAQSAAEAAEAAPSDALSAAGEAMRHSENALRRGDFAGAQNAQAAALDNLRRGAGALAPQAPDAEAQAIAGENGEASGAADLADPLGRGTNEGERSREGENAGDPSRTRALFEDIVRRAQEPSRPEAEREYLRRLLDRFGDD